MTRRDARRTWAAQHGCKRVYRSRGRAWLVIVRLWVKDRQVVNYRRGRARFLVPYECTWTDNYHEDRRGPAHIHIGHQSWHGSAARRRLHRWVLWPWQRHVLWPFYRARSRWRRYRKSRLTRTGRGCPGQGLPGSPSSA